MGADKVYMSISGMMSYDPHVLDDMVIPEEIDRETLMDNIYLECAELECIYPDPAFFRKAVKAWSRKELPVWEKLYETTQYEYNPIWNKDGTVTETHTRNLSDTENRNLHSADHAVGSNSSHTEGSSEDTEKVSAFNASGFSDRQHNEAGTETDGSGSFDNTSTHDDTGSVTKTGTGSETISREEKGNIGVTTTQQMINEEREVDRFNIMDVIISSFKNRFCLLIY